ncbi:MAG: valine--tRNA ligase [Clostridia bacterium]|nr:valine--tRNA ligase [Clostridia bacterium]
MREHKLDDKYNAKSYEDDIYKFWCEREFFKPSEDRNKKPYTIVIPPPNITANLHIGHALDNTIQDILIRYKRMSGFNTLWLPGTDHAAIATEVKIVQKLKEEGLSKDILGREEFLKRAWQWKEEYGGNIINQLKKLGCSCDWSRMRFTLDEGLTNAVTQVFVNLYNKDLIYKGKRMINWCPCCNTSIADAEVEHEEEQTHLWHIRYKIKDSDDYVIVATTRPETMLGDTGVAVHPSDERYKDLVGKTVILPIMNKEIPVIADYFVEKEFGTGAVKLTPAHDPNDYQAALKHNLDIIEVFDENFKMGNLVPEYEGMDMYEARKIIVEKLKEIGALVKIEDYTHNVGKCYRCHNTIEPKISMQWFVRMEPLAKPAIKAVKDDETRFVPKKFETTYFNWMENIQDWCISRQLWWGHRIPAYYCEDCGEIIVSKDRPDKCTKCGSKKLHQDEDTLDTWFSSALWPFSTLGWPEKTDDFNYFYPTNTLVTGFDIITFWVSKMIFSGIEHTGEVPFKDVFIHGLVRDSQGRKMSKSLGNGIDPLELIEKFDTDSLRFSLINGITPGNDIRYMPEKLESASNFANKLWNASKFVLMNLEDVNNDFSKMKQEDVKLSYEDKWIISKLNNVIKDVTTNLDNYDLGVALQTIQDFIWNEFCAWYIEIVKIRLYNKEDGSRLSAQWTLNKVLQDSLKLLHPFMPFITEKIYQNLYNNDDSIMISNWPKYSEDNCFIEEQNKIEELKEIITGIRNARNSMNVHPSKKSKLIFITKDFEKVILESGEFIKKLGFGSEIVLETNKNSIPKNAVSIISKNIELYMPFEDLVDMQIEIERLNNKKDKILLEMQKVASMVENPSFVAKAPKEKVEEAKDKYEDFKRLISSIDKKIDELENM